MSMKSSGLADKLLKVGGNSFADIFALGFIRLFKDAAPLTADAAETGTLLCVISVGSTGTGITFDTIATHGVLPKKASETWSGLLVASGTATHYRLVPATNTTGSSLTEARVQGTVGLTGASDMVLTNTSLTSGNTFTLPNYTQYIVIG